MIDQNDPKRPFNPSEHFMQISKKDYLPVQWRLVWFREQCPQGTIDTEEILVDLDREVQEEVSVWNNEKKRSEKVLKIGKGYARFRAVVTDGKGGRATGTKTENAASFPDYVEKAETGAIGRALAALGYGTQFVGDELEEGHRIVDSPVERPMPAAKPTQQGVTPIKDRINEVYALAKRNGHLSGCKTTEEAMKKFLKLCGDTCKADIPTINQLTLQRLAILEEFITKADPITQAS